MKNYRVIALAFCLFSGMSFNLSASTDTLAGELALQWAKITYDSAPGQAKAALKKLYGTARSQVTIHKDNEEVLGWAGIITASYAGAKGGLGALKLAKEARGYLESAIEINPEALDGGARSSLGVLYYQVPPWPVGFGNIKRAEKLLAESYQKHPANMDVLYFYADFLQRQKRYEGAKNLLQKAQTLPVRPYRVLADTGRQKQIAQKLLNIDAKT